MTRDDVIAAAVEVLGEPLGLCLDAHREQAERIADLAEARAASQEPPSAAPAPSVPVAPAAPPVGAEARRATLPPSSDCRDYDGPTCTVLDVSHWQGEIDWTAVASSPAVYREREVGQPVAVVIRTGDGQTEDDHAVDNLVGALLAGVDVVDVYHYLRAAHPAAVQWAVVKRVLRAAADRLRKMGRPELADVCATLWIWWDVEGGPDPDGDGPREAKGAWQHLTRSGKPIGHGRPVRTVEVFDCVRELGLLAEGAGHSWGLYTGAAWRDHVREPPAWTWGVPLWLAVGARGRIPGPWTLRDVRLWQYTARGRVRGIVGPVDLNRYLGTAEELRALAGAQRVG